MPTNFSIDEEYRNIPHKKTRDNFSEVLSTYSNGNYRSAIVMLWSTIVCDALHKLKDAVDILNDSTAKSIFEEIKNAQGDKRNSRWEEHLLKLINKRTNSLPNQDLEHLLQIRQIRHMSAHPSLDDEFNLYSPNKDQTRAHIRNAMECLLTKPGLFTNETFNFMLEDIEDKKSILNSKAKLENFLKSRYFNQFQKEDIGRVFKKLWKLTFRTENPRCDENREVNFNAIWVLLDHANHDCVQLVKDEPNYFSNISSSHEPLTYLTRLLTVFPNIFKKLRDDARTIITESLKNSIRSQLLSTFIYNNKGDYLDSIKKLIEDNADKTDHSTINPSDLITLRELLSSSKGEITPEIVHDIAIHTYIMSQSYTDADKNFHTVHPFLKDLTREQMTHLLTKANQNSQIHGRERKWPEERNLIRNHALHHGIENFDHWRNLR